MMKIDEELTLLREASDTSSHPAALHLFPLSPDLGHPPHDDANHHDPHPHNNKPTDNHPHHARLDGHDDDHHKTINLHLSPNNKYDGQLQSHQLESYSSSCQCDHHQRIYSHIHTIPSTLNHSNIKSHMPHKTTMKNNHRLSSSSRSITKKQDRTLVINRVHTNPSRNKLNVMMTNPANAIERLSRDGRQLHEVFRKKLTSSDVSCQQDRLLMAKEWRGCLGKHNTPSPENRNVKVDMWDETDGPKYSLIHGIWKSNGSYVLKGKWRSFRDFKHLNVGDTIVISMDDSDGTIWIRQERATIQRTWLSNTSSMDSFIGILQISWIYIHCHCN